MVLLSMIKRVIMSKSNKFDSLIGWYYVE